MAPTEPCKDCGKQGRGRDSANKHRTKKHEGGMGSWRRGQGAEEGESQYRIQFNKIMMLEHTHRAHMDTTPDTEGRMVCEIDNLNVCCVDIMWSRV